MYSFRQSALAILIPLSLMSCRPEWGVGSRSLIVESWIESGGYPVVILSESVTPSTEETSFEECVVTTAKVTVCCDDRCVVLSGGVDHNYFPPFTYTTAHITGEPGKTYTLDIYYRNRHYSAETSIPEPCEISELESYSIKDGNAYGISAVVNDSQNTHRWLQFFVRNRTKETRYYPSVLGFNDNRSYNVLTAATDTSSAGPEGPAVRLKVNPGRHVIDGSRYNMFFERHDTVQVKLASMDSVSGIFWKQFQKIESTSELGLFSTFENLEGNVAGAKGYWCGFGISYKGIIIE